MKTFQKDGKTRTAASVGQEVSLRFNGWTEVTDEQALQVPPVTGPGSGKAAWHDYATAVGVTVDPEASREDVIAQLAAAGIPTGA